MTVVTFRDFAKLVRRRGWTAASLAERFRGKIEGSREFFERVLRSDSGPADRSGGIIPYRSVIEFYRKKLCSSMAGGQSQLCDCGCGKSVLGRKKLASAACRKRMERRRSRTPESGVKKAKKDGAFSVIF